MKFSLRLSACAGFLAASGALVMARAEEPAIDLGPATSSNASLRPAVYELPNAPPAKPEPVDDQGDQRILFIMPGYEVSNRQDAAPLSAKEKLRRAVKGTIDPYTWISTGFTTAMSQAGNQFPQYGQGTAGFVKRYGAATLDGLTGEFSGTAYCILFKEDPRYFRLGHGSVWHRLGYSLAQEFSAKSDRGTRMFKWSEPLGTFTSSALSNLYYPPASRGFGLTMTRAATSFLWDFTGELPDEFWPDVKRRLFHRTHGLAQ